MTMTFELFSWHVNHRIGDDTCSLHIQYVGSSKIRRREMSLSWELRSSVKSVKLGRHAGWQRGQSRREAPLNCIRGAPISMPPERTKKKPQQRLTSSLPRTHTA